MHSINSINLITWFYTICINFVSLNDDDDYNESFLLVIYMGYGTYARESGAFTLLTYANICKTFVNFLLNKESNVTLR